MRAAAALIGLIALHAAASAADPQADKEAFAPFRITSFEGAITLRQLLDRAESRSDSATGSQPWTSQSDRNTSVVASISGRGFVYHPNMLSLEGGVGLVLQRARFTTDAAGPSGDTRADERLHEFRLRATVLRDKPYFGSVYYEHLNPSVSLGPALVMVQQTTRRGLQLTVLDAVSPIPLTIDAERLRASGRGGGRIVLDQTERYSLTADRAHGRDGSTRLRVDDSRLDSQSGAEGLPITRRNSHALVAGLDTRLQLGAGRGTALSHLISYNAQRYDLTAGAPADRHDWRERADLRTRHNDRWRSFATYDALNTRQGESRSRVRGASAGGSWTPTSEHVSTLEARGESFRSADFASSSRSALASTSQQGIVAGGRAQATYSARYDDRRQRVTNPTTAVVGERRLLPGSTPVALDRTRVLTGSIQVWNEARTQLYLEGRDYLVSTLGAQTRLQRVVAGDLIDGQAVLVDYSFDTGGSFDSTQLEQSLGLAWAWGSRFSVSARWSDVTPRVTDGQPSFALNTVRSRTLRAQGEWPVTPLWSLGGNMENEERRETIQPYRRRSTEVFVQWDEAFFGPGGIRLGWRRQRVDFENSPQDVDMEGVDLRYQVYTSDGVDAQVDWTSETDTGSPVRRRRDYGTLRARWRYRQMLMTLSLTRAHEVQNDFSTTRTVGQWLLRREF